VEGVEPSLPALEAGGVTVRYTHFAMQLSLKTKEPPRGGFPAGGSSGFRALVVLYPAASLRVASPFLDKAAINGEHTRAGVSSRLMADQSVTGGASLLNGLEPA
jgi:hypothetical protein